MRTEAFGRPRAGDSPLHRRNPTVKLAVLLVVTTGVVAVLDPWTPGALYLAALLAVRVGATLPWRVLLSAQLFFAPFAVSILVVNAVTRPGDPVPIGPVRVTDVGLAVGMSLLLRTMLVGTLSTAFVLTTDAGRLMTSLHQHARLGARGTYAVVAGYRMLEQLPGLWATVRLAQGARDGRRRGTGPSRSPAALGRAAFTLLVVTLRQSERMAIAMETRGLGSGPRTVHRPVGLDGRDVAFAAVTIGSVAAVVAASAAAGLLTSWGAVAP